MWKVHKRRNIAIKLAGNFCLPVYVSALDARTGHVQFKNRGTYANIFTSAAFYTLPYSVDTISA